MRIQLENLDDVEFYLVAFSNGSQDFSASCLYIVTLHKFNDTCTVQLVTTSSKIQNLQQDSVVTVPHNELHAC